MGLTYLSFGFSCSCKLLLLLQVVFGSCHLLLLAPLVLLPHLLLLTWGEVILDVECLPDLLRGLALDHVGHSLAGDVKEPLDVKVVGSQDQLKEGSLVNLKKICVPGRNVIGPLLFVLIILRATVL